ncbi:unnamed protein product [Didymodactylos carnosus]|uniref:Uncharacterized protein n=1 Tax=Didymodactylos carnosus TaxID=1234261 RepID=A0A8S2EUX3_9BILA|nr:unnamed protein product [Didymodactylos carnosus]CAF4124878.1 unnamed protein product [Didymodactylos carnosus]
MEHLILNDVLKRINFIEKEIGLVAKVILEIQDYDTPLSIARNNDDVFAIFNNDEAVSDAKNKLYFSQRYKPKTRIKDNQITEYDISKWKQKLSKILYWMLLNKLN